MLTLSSFRPRTGRFGRPVTVLPATSPSAVVDCAVHVDGHRLPGRFSHEEAAQEVRRRGSGPSWTATTTCC